MQNTKSRVYFNNIYSILTLQSSISESTESAEEQCKKWAYIIQGRLEKSEGDTNLMYLRKPVCAKYSQERVLKWYPCFSLKEDIHQTFEKAHYKF